MQQRTGLQVGVGCQPAFWASGGFNSAEEALAEIENRRKEKEGTIELLAELALSYEGSLNYETLKSYPNREIVLLSETMNKINKRKEAMMTGALKGGAINPADMGDIGNFDGNMNSEIS